MEPNKWFGKKPWGPICEGLEHTPTPVGEICSFCDETIGEDDDGEVIGHYDADGESYRPVHKECLLRQVVGSVGHLQKKCSCFGGSKDADLDPPGMTKRQAALAAARQFIINQLASKAEEAEEALPKDFWQGINLDTDELTVDKCFSKRGTVMPFDKELLDKQQYQSPEDLVKKFDRPQDVAIIETPHGKALCHKRDVQWIKTRETITNSILAKRGWKMPEDIEKLTLEEILQVRDAVTKIMNEQN